MSHEAFWQAVIPEPRRVLHAELLPFSAGKIVLLHRVQSVFAIGGQVTEDQLATAVLMCGQTFSHACASLNDPTTPLYLEKFRKQLVKAVPEMFDRKRNFTPEALAEHAALFKCYMEDGSKFPLTYAPKNYKPEVGITNLPLVQHVRATLKHFYHVSDAEFWDMPWGLALWDYYTAPVLNGTGDLVENEAITSASHFADEDFKRANPTLFDADGTLNALGRKTLKRPATEASTHA